MEYRLFASRIAPSTCPARRSEASARATAGVRAPLFAERKSSEEAARSDGMIAHRRTAARSHTGTARRLGSERRLRLWQRSSRRAGRSSSRRVQVWKPARKQVVIDSPGQPHLNLMMRGGEQDGARRSTVSVSRSSVARHNTSHSSLGNGPARQPQRAGARSGCTKRPPRSLMTPKR